MAFYLPSSGEMDAERPADSTHVDQETGEISDLKIFWGPEICRLEYLLHLMETGRIIDEYSKAQA